MAHRVFGPRPVPSKTAPSKTAPRKPVGTVLGSIAETLASDMGQDGEMAERNAQRIALVLKRALKRRKTLKTGDRN